MTASVWPPPHTHRCGLCGCDALRPLVEFDDVRVAHCGGCSSGLVVHLSDPASTTNYSAAYEAESVARKAEACFDLLSEANLVRPGSRVLDVGCGTGGFLDLARRAGLNTMGIEVDARTAELAAARGHRVEARSASEGPWPPSLRCDTVTFWDVLEHLDEPGRAIEHAAGVLVPGGTLMLVTPFLGSVWDRAGRVLHGVGRGRFPQLLRMCWSRDHLYRFDADGLAGVLRTLGFATVQTSRRLLLSLQADRYAGGEVLRTWTGSRLLDGALSLAGVQTAKVLQLHNKIVVVATKGAPDGVT